MDIKTRFNIGDKVFTIDKKTMKVREFEIGSASVFASKDEKLDVKYYDNEYYSRDGYEESFCFATEKELLGFITTKEPAEKEAKG